MPGTHVASKGVATCNLVIKKKAVSKETATCPEQDLNLHTREGSST